MSHDTKIGTTLNLTVDINYSPIEDMIGDQLDANPFEVRSYTSHSVDTTEDLICEYVTAAYSHKEGVTDRVVPSNLKNYKYLVKAGDKYAYTDLKPYLFKYFSPKLFIDIDGKTYSQLTDEFKNFSIKATRGLVYSAGTDTVSTMVYSFPFGGISKTNSLFYIKSGNDVYEINDSEFVDIDYLEGTIYIKQTYPKVIDSVFGIFDIEPIKITTVGKMSTKNMLNGFVSIGQRNLYGTILIKRLSDVECLVVLPYNAMIVPSTPYQLSVDGVNVDQPRYCQKGETLYIKQELTLDKSLPSVTEELVSSPTTTTSFISEMSTAYSNMNLKDNSASGLFIYRDILDDMQNLSPTYLPLFK